MDGIFAEKYIEMMRASTSLNFIFKSMCVWATYMSVQNMFLMTIEDRKERVRSPVVGVLNHCEPPCGC